MDSVGDSSPGSSMLHIRIYILLPENTTVHPILNSFSNLFLSFSSSSPRFSFMLYFVLLILRVYVLIIRSWMITGE